MVGQTASNADGAADNAPNVMTVFPSKLYGEVTVSGAKNSCVRLLAASILTSEELVLENYPSKLLDAKVHVEMLEALGKSCVVEGNRISIQETNGITSDLAWDKRSIRNTLLILGALVARNGRGSVPHPGGCQIGIRDRPALRSSCHAA